MDPITLPSGSRLVISIAPFSAGNRLMKTVARELSGVSFDLDLKSFDKLSDNDINVLKNVAFQLLQSDALEQALMECMKRCLYNDEKITEKTFEPENTRPDYLPVAWEVMKANLTPFFSALGSLFSKKSQAPSGDPT